MNEDIKIEGIDVDNDNYLTSLVNKHKRLDEDIKDMERFFVSDFRVQHKKKEKLKLKDDIVKYVKEFKG